jgi:hypothetical protein
VLSDLDRADLLVNADQSLDFLLGERVDRLVVVLFEVVIIVAQNSSCSQSLDMTLFAHAALSPF